MNLKIILIIFLSVLFMTSLTQSSIAVEDVEIEVEIKGDPVSAAMPEIDEVYNPKKNNYKPITKYRDNYYIDTVEEGFSPIDEGIAMTTNLLFSLQRTLIESMIFLFDMTMSFNSYKIFDNILEGFITEMYKSVYGVLAGIMLSFLGIFFFIKMIKQEQVEFWAGLFKTVVVIAIATFYFTNPLFIAEKVEKASNEVTDMVLSASNKVNAPSSNKSKKDVAPITLIANELWEEYVHIPWRNLEFGDDEVADKYEEDILKIQSKNPKREDLVKDMEEKSGISTQSMVIDRLGFMIMYFIPVLINTFLMMLLCILIIGLQFLVTLIFVLGVFVFILALVPSFGTETLKKWAWSIAFLSGTKIIMAFVLMILLAFNRALFNAFDEDGWMKVLFLQLAIYLAMYIFRDNVFRIFAIAKDVLSNPKRAFDRIQKHGEINPYSSGYGQVGILASRERRQKFKQNIEDNIQKNVRKTVDGAGKTIKLGKDAYGASKQFSKHVKNDIDNARERSKAKKYLENKYRFKRDRVRKVEAENPTKFHKDMNFVDRIERRKNNYEPSFKEDEVQRVIKRRRKVKEYLDQKSNRKNNININDNFKTRSIERKTKRRYIPGGRIARRKLEGKDNEKE